jgi:DDE superfamily endonuclease
MDNGSSHRGQLCTDRLQEKWKNTVTVHTPVHASWLNQIEIYFSVVQRKVLTPSDFDSVADGQDRIFRFRERYEQVAKPFEWKFTRRDLYELLARLDRPACLQGEGCLMQEYIIEFSDRSTERLEPPSAHLPHLPRRGGGIHLSTKHLEKSHAIDV